MPLLQPDINGSAYDFGRIEIDLAAAIFTAFDGIKYDQPLEEGVIYGTRAEPLKRTRGRLQMGAGELKFSDIEEARRFLAALGDGYLEKTWDASITYSAEGKDPIRDQLFGCRLLNVADDHSGGTDALSETMPFSFMRMLRNGKTALINQI
jgi:hypothetical protein